MLWMMIIHYIGRDRHGRKLVYEGIELIRTNGGIIIDFPLCYKLACGTLVIISSLVIISVCSHIFGQLPDYSSPTFSLVFSLTVWSKQRESKQWERLHGDQTKRKRRGAPLSSEPDGGTRQSHPAEEERNRWGGEHKHTHTLGEHGRGEIREGEIRQRTTGGRC